MKLIVVVAIVLVLAFLIWWFVFHESPPAKSYRHYKEAEMTAQGFTKQTEYNRRWSLKIDSCEIKGPEAVLEVTEETMVIPPGAASFVFANITTRKLQVELINQNGNWIVSLERVLSETTSTFDDRKNRSRSSIFIINLYIQNA